MVNTGQVCIDSWSVHLGEKSFFQQAPSPEIKELPNWLVAKRKETKGGKMLKGISILSFLHRPNCISFSPVFLSTFSEILSERIILIVLLR